MIKFLKYLYDISGQMTTIHDIDDIVFVKNMGKLRLANVKRIGRTQIYVKFVDNGEYFGVEPERVFRDFRTLISNRL